MLKRCARQWVTKARTNFGRSVLHTFDTQGKLNISPRQVYTNDLDGVWAQMPTNRWGKKFKKSNRKLKKKKRSSKRQNRWKKEAEKANTNLRRVTLVLFLILVLLLNNVYVLMGIRSHQHLHLGVSIRTSASSVLREIIIILHLYCTLVGRHRRNEPNNPIRTVFTGRFIRRRGVIRVRHCHCPALILLVIYRVSLGAVVVSVLFARVFVFIAVSSLPLPSSVFADVVVFARVVIGRLFDSRFCGASRRLVSSLSGMS